MVEGIILNEVVLQLIKGLKFLFRKESKIIVCFIIDKVCVMYPKCTDDNITVYSYMFINSNMQCTPVLLI